MRTAARGLGCCLALVLLAALAACTDNSSGGGPTPPDSTSPTASPTLPVDLSFGVYGSTEEVAAYARMAKEFDATEARANVTVTHWRTHAGLRRDVENGAPLPDVFLVSRRDLRWFLERQLTRPVDSLLDERGVDFGDSYTRDAITAFSSDNRLQCMPYGVEPDVIFVNQDLVDFTKMANRGLDVPTDARRWSWDQFVTAVNFAARPAEGVQGFGIEPTLPGLAPLIYAGGGDLFDDDTTPTSLAFSGDGTMAALQTVLPVLGDPQLSLTSDQLREQSPLDWFEQGKVGMVVGNRSSVPELRKVPGLRWDVMPIPSIGRSTTFGEISGLCISQAAESPATAADFLVYATGKDAVTEVARGGYFQPANQEVAFSDAFLQPTRPPLSGSVFNDAATRMSVPPLIDTWPELESLADPYLDQAVHGGPTVDLTTVMQDLDEASLAILSPPTTSPSPGATDSASSGAASSAGSP